MTIKPTQALRDAFVGKVLMEFEFGRESDDRTGAIGKTITRARFGFNDDREDAGLWINVEGVDDPIFVYDNEGLTLSD